MKRRVLSLLLAVMMMVVMLPVSSRAETTHFTSWEDLIAAEGIVEQRTDRVWRLLADITVSDAFSIPEGKVLQVYYNASMAADGLEILGTLENYGILTLDGGSTALQGALYNFGRLSVQNNAAITASASSLIEQYGELMIESGGGVISAGEIRNLSYLRVASGSSLIMEEGGSYIPDAGNILESEGGTLLGVSGWITDVAVASDLTELQDLLNDAGSSANIHLRGDVTVPDSLAIPEGRRLYIDSGASIGVAGGGTLTNDGQLWVGEDALVTANGTFENNSVVRVSGGQMLLQDGAALANEDRITVRLGGLLHAVEGAHLQYGDNSSIAQFGTGHITGSVEQGVRFHDLDFLNALIEEDGTIGYDDQQKTYYLYDTTLTVTGDVEIPSEIRLEIGRNGVLNIPAGASLANGKEIYVFENGKIQLDGALINRNYMRVFSGGTFVKSEEGAYVYGQNSALEVNSTATLIGEFPPDFHVNYIYDVTSEAELQEAMTESAAREEYRNHFDVIDSFALTQDVTIGENRALRIYGENVTLTIPENITLNNLGEINLWDRSGLVVAGTLVTGDGEGEEWSSRLTASEHARIDIASGGAVLLRADAGMHIDNGAAFAVQGGGLLHNQGWVNVQSGGALTVAQAGGYAQDDQQRRINVSNATVSGLPNEYIDQTQYYDVWDIEGLRNAIEEIGNVEDPDPQQQYRIIVLGELALEQDEEITIGSNVVLELAGGLNREDANGRMVVQSASSLTIADGGRLELNGGTMRVERDSKLHFMGGSTLYNRGLLSVYPGGEVIADEGYTLDYGDNSSVITFGNEQQEVGVITGDLPKIVTIQDWKFLDLLAGDDGGVGIWNRDYVLTGADYRIVADEFYIPQDKALIVSQHHCTLTIPEGTTVYNDFYMAVKNTGKLFVYGTLHNNGTLVVEAGGTLDAAEGTYEPTEQAVLQQMDGAVINGIDGEHISQFRLIEDMQDLEAANAEAQSASTRLFARVASAFIVESDISLDENVFLELFGPEASLTIPTDVMLTSHDISIGEDSALTIESGGKLIIASGGLYSNSRAKITVSGVLQVGDGVGDGWDARLDMGDGAETVVLNGGKLVLRSDGGLNLNEGTKLAVRDGGLLQNNGWINLYKATLDIENVSGYTQGDTEKRINAVQSAVPEFLSGYVQSQRYYDIWDANAFNEAILEIQNAAEPGTEYFLNVLGEVTLTQNVKTEANTVLLLSGDGARLTVPGGISLEIAQGSKMEVNSGCAVVAANGRVTIKGTLQNNAEIRVEPSGRLTVSVTGEYILGENARLKRLPGAIISGIAEGQMINAREITSAAQFNAAAAEAAAYPGMQLELAVLTPVALSKSVTLPGNVALTLFGADKTLTIPAGVTLTTRGAVFVHDGASIVVSAGGTLKYAEGSFQMNNGGGLRVYGTVLTGTSEAAGNEQRCAVEMNDSSITVEPGGRYAIYPDARLYMHEGSVLHLKSGAIFNNNGWMGVTNSTFTLEAGATYTQPESGPRISAYKATFSEGFNSEYYKLEGFRDAWNEEEFMDALAEASSSADHIYHIRIAGNVIYDEATMAIPANVRLEIVKAGHIAGSDGRLTILGGQTLTIDGGSTLEGAGELYLEGGSLQVDGGSVVLTNGAALINEGYLDISGGGSLQVDAGTKIEQIKNWIGLNGANLTIYGDVFISYEGNESAGISMANGSELAIKNGGMLKFFIGYSALTAEDSNVLIENGGTLFNNGMIFLTNSALHAAAGSVYEQPGEGPRISKDPGSAVTGIAENYYTNKISVEVYNTEQFYQALEDAAESQETATYGITIRGYVALNRPQTDLRNADTEVAQGGTLEVPAGVTFSIDRGLFLEDGTLFINGGAVSYYSSLGNYGKIHIAGNGVLTAEEGSQYETGDRHVVYRESGQINAPVPEGTHIRDWNDLAYFVDGHSPVSKAGDDAYVLGAGNTFTLLHGMEIPAEGTLTIEGTFRVPENRALSNLGFVDIKAQGNLLVEGLLNNEGRILVETQGTLDVSSGGYSFGPASELRGEEGSAISGASERVEVIREIANQNGLLDAIAEAGNSAGGYKYRLVVTQSFAVTTAETMAITLGSNQILELNGADIELALGENVSFYNNGVIRLTDHATLIVEEGAKLQHISGDVTLDGGSRIIVRGELKAGGAQVQARRMAVSFMPMSVTTETTASITVTGGSSVVVEHGVLNIDTNGGLNLENASVQLTNGAQLQNSGSVTASNATVSANSATVTNASGATLSVTNAGAVQLNNGATMNNQGGATLALSNESRVQLTGSGTALTNAGTLSASNASAVTVTNARLENSGQVSVNSSSNVSVSGEGAQLNNSGAMTVLQSSLTLEGEAGFTQGEGAMLAAAGSEIQGVGEENITNAYSADVTDQQSFETEIANAAEYSGEDAFVINVYAPVTLLASRAIGSGAVTINIVGGDAHSGMLTIADGAAFTMAGTVYVQEGRLIVNPDAIYINSGTLVNGGIVQVKGTFTNNGTYEADGGFLFAEDGATLDGSSPIEPDSDVLYGDVDGDLSITLQDALMICNYKIGKAALNAKQLAAANVDGDSSVTLQDALMIGNYKIGRITVFPAAE